MARKWAKTREKKADRQAVNREKQIFSLTNKERGDVLSLNSKQPWRDWCQLWLQSEAILE